MTMRISAVALLCLLAAAGASAQAPAKPGAPAAQAAAPAPSASAPTAPAPAAPASAAPASTPVEPPVGFTYDAEGRRDPFLSLLGRGNDPRTTTARPAGVPGLMIADVTVKGIVRNRGGFIAMIAGSDNKTYIVRAGDRLFDGSVKSIVQDKVIFSQDVNDPLSLVKQREIPKPVRQAEGGPTGGGHEPRQDDVPSADPV
jgi:Tfp pilus assembly protein PilP